jgi:hypothetical protein
MNIPVPTAPQFFAVIATGAIAAISYFPPAHNADALYTLAIAFLGHCVKDIFAKSEKDEGIAQSADAKP